jgi:hypothetical protein
MSILTRDNISCIPGIFVLNEAKAIHELNLGDFASAMATEMFFDIVLVGWEQGRKESASTGASGPKVIFQALHDDGTGPKRIQERLDAILPGEKRGSAEIIEPAYQFVEGCPGRALCLIHRPCCADPWPMESSRQMDGWCNLSLEDYPLFMRPQMKGAQVVVDRVMEKSNVRLPVEANALHYLGAEH